MISESHINKIQLEGITFIDAILYSLEYSNGVLKKLLDWKIK